MKFRPVYWTVEELHWDWNSRRKLWVCRENGKTRTRVEMEARKKHFKGTFVKFYVKA